MAIFRLIGAAHNELYFYSVSVWEIWKQAFLTSVIKKDPAMSESGMLQSTSQIYTLFCGYHVISLFYVFKSDALEALEGLIFLQ